MDNRELEKWGMVAGGAALIIYGLQRRSPLSLVGAVVGAAVAVHGLGGSRYRYADTAAGAVMPHDRGTTVDKVVTIDKPVEELYRFWRNLENLPRFMTNIEAVTQMDARRSHWVVLGPGGKRYEWDAEIIHEEENSLISWRTVEGSDVAHAGSVHFSSQGPGRGTAVRAIIRYDPPGGRLAAAMVRLVGQDPGKQLAEDLRRLKQLLEIGEVPITEGQPSGAATPVKSKMIGLMRDVAAAR
jgi:uncharacterized membrane protein